MPRSSARKPALAILLLTSFLLLAACKTEQNPEVKDARVILPPPGMSMAAGYFRLDNPGSTPVTLKAITSAAFDSVEMHETIVEQGVSKMRALEQVQISPGSSADFEPGGRHLMMFGPQKNLDLLAEIPMTLVLDRPDGSQIKLQANFTVEHAGEHEGHAAH